MKVCMTAKRTTLMKKDLETAWRSAYTLRQDMHFIIDNEGDWNAAAKNSNPALGRP